MSPSSKVVNRFLLFAVALGLSVPRWASAGLPLTPSTTYVANGTPVVKAQDLNDLQKYLAGLYSAIYTVKALVIDGNGGASASGVAGTVQVSAATSGFSNAAPFALASVPFGQVGKEQVILGAARCSVAAGVISSCGGFNLKSATVAAQVYTVQFNTAGPNSLRHTATITPISTSAVSVSIISSTISGGAYQVTFSFFDSTGSATDPNGFMIQATGG
jgi:hypothetical protein